MLSVLVSISLWSSCGRIYHVGEIPAAIDTQDKFFGL